MADTTPPPKHAAERLGPAEVTIFCLVCVALAILWRGYLYGRSDQVPQLAMVFRELDPTFAVGDFFLAGGHGPRVCYVHLLAALASVGPLPVVCFVLTFLAHLVIVSATYCAYRDLIDDSHLGAMIACVLVLATRGINPGAGPELFAVCLVPRHLALGLALLSLWSGIRARPVVSSALACVAAALHPLIGAQTGCIALATATGVFVLSCRRSGAPRASALRKQALRTICGWVLLAATVLLLWQTKSGEAISLQELKEVYAELRAPHDLLPSTWGAKMHAQTFVFLASLLVSWVWWTRQPCTDGILALGVLLPVIMVVVLFAGGWFFVEVIPSRLWIIAQTWRISYIVRWIGFILFARTISSALSSKAEPGRLALAGIMLMGSGDVQPFLIGLGHLAELARRALSRVLDLSAQQVGMVLALLIAGVAVGKSGNETESVLLAILVATGAWFLVLPKRWYRPAIPLALLCALTGAIVAERAGWTTRVPSFVGRRMLELSMDDWVNPEDDVAEYARENTDAASLFLIPPLLGRFRLVSRRAIVVDFKSFPLAEEAMAEWRQRLDDCYGPVREAGFEAAEEMGFAYQRISDERMGFVARKYGASFAVLHRQTATALPVIYQGRYYKIARID